MIRSNRSLMTVFSALALFAACKPAAESINVTPDNVQLTDKNATAQLNAEPVDKSGARVEGVTVTWSSSDPAIATVDAASGLVTAVSSGNATVSAKTEKLNRDVPVVVSIAGSIKLDKPTLDLKPEMTSDSVTAQILDDKGNPWTGQGTVTWTSADPAIATVEAGKVTGVGAGSTTVTATFNTLTATVTVNSTVAPAAPVDGAVPADPAAAAGAAPAADAAAPAAGAAPAAAPAPAAPATK